jgi:hypothetical protein
MNYDLIEEGVKTEIKKLYQESVIEPLFHDKRRRKDLIKLVKEFATIIKMTNEETFLLSCSALLYGTGYLNISTNAETASLENANRIFLKNGLNQEQIDDVKRNISAAFGSIIPETKNAQLFCDCVFAFYGGDDFKDDIKLLWEEEKMRNGTASKPLFYKDLLKQLDKHRYFTIAAQERFNAQKLHNRLYLIEEIPDTSLVVKEHHKSVIEHQDAKLVEPKAIKGIDTMFKISSTNQQRLSDLADNKAHILITVNSIILSAILSILLRRLTESHFLIIPTALILGVSLAAMVFAILATRPSVPHGISTREQIDNNQVNLLFFGNFYRMPIDDFRYGMGKMMESSDVLYHSLITDVYMQGVVLGKKYKLLRISYNIFMYGLIVSVLAFAVAAAFFATGTATLSNV